MAEAKLQVIPLVFAFKQVVLGKGFIAVVRMNGRALLETEQLDDHEEAWITGIEPVGIAGGGGDRGVAFVEFRNAWIAVLFDIAAKASSFKEFHTACRSFLNAKQGHMTTLWEDAVAAVRRNKYVDPSLRREEKSDERPVSFEVVDLTSERHGAEQNQVETGLQVAA